MLRERGAVGGGLSDGLVVEDHAADELVDAVAGDQQLTISAAVLLGALGADGIETLNVRPLKMIAAIADWPLLNALLNTAGGATWVSLHHGGGVGMGYSQHAGLVIVCDGTEAADKRIARVLWNDPASGVMRHADAGYQEAIQCAKENKLNLPMLE